jgi:hypothetical protein
VGGRTTCAACERWFDGADRLYQCRTCPECGVVTRCVVVPPPEVYFAWLLRVTLAAAVGALAGAAVVQLTGG